MIIEVTQNEYMITLYWGVLGGREGWWLNVPGEKIRMIHSPSICNSSGGGALKALKIVRTIEDYRFFEETIRITPQEPHFRFRGGECKDPTCFGHDK
jgi:hypothetical protein